MRIKRTRADDIFSKLIRKRDNYICQVCLKKFPPAKLQCHHHIGRRHFSVRFDYDNAIAICFGCHRKFHENPSWHVEWWKKRLGEERYRALIVKSNLIQKRDFKMAEIKLKALWDKIK